MKVKVLGTRIGIIKEINSYNAKGIVEATSVYNDVMNFIESKQELTFNMANQSMFNILYHLRYKKLIDFKTEDELASDEDKKEQLAFILKYNEAIAWKHSLSDKELEYVEVLQKGSQIVCSAE